MSKGDHIIYRSHCHGNGCLSNDSDSHRDPIVIDAVVYISSSSHDLRNCGTRYPVAYSSVLCSHLLFISQKLQLHKFSYAGDTKKNSRTDLLPNHMIYV